ncbi:MAG: CapA family protein [Spirochaetaceae bacterium]|jgi:poly-gamma-glutamate synthesis protein (capsule biosynthesis protein)|nr:CapA family protein [Spirochaetaceae bacterium]
MKLISLLFFCAVICFGSCRPAGEPSGVQEPPPIHNPEEALSREDTVFPAPSSPAKELLLTFAGDIMAHQVNFRMENYDFMYDNVREFLNADDLTFGNYEAPVTSSLPYQTYPNFNTQGPYARAVIDAGFDVFSLVNNHTNDQGKQGIRETREWFEVQRFQEVYSAGIKTESNGPLAYQIIEEKGWKILFVAVTEILNAFNSKELLDYIPPTEKARESFAAELTRLRAENPCDLFIVSVHVHEPEYTDIIREARRTYFYSLLDSGADIIWAHHPHVMHDWEVITDEGQSFEEGSSSELPSSGEYLGRKLIMYSMGNFISGQRFTRNLENPGAPREYTGDSILLRVRLEKDDQARITEIVPVPLTVTVDPQGKLQLHYFTAEFIESLKEPLAGYYTKRLELMQKYKGNTICR